MVLRDQLGNEYTGATPSGVEHFEHGLRLLQCYIGDPVSICDAAIKEAPDMVMSHVLRTWLQLLSTEAPALVAAREALERTAPLPANSRERGHLAAIRHLSEGRWNEAARTLEDVTIAHPHDALALLVGHQLDFFTGQSRMLRDRIARALPQWNERQPGYHSLLGMHAFGLEECGDYARAETSGRRALELEPRDGWAQHAVAHVFEMTGRKREGLRWMRANPDLWSRDSFFAVHNWWHTAIFHLDLGEAEAALALYDGAIYGRRSRLVLEMIDAAALLWRLELRGVDVGDRWNTLADDWEPHAGSGNYVFNDAHAALAFLRAGRTGPFEAMLETQSAVMISDGDNARFTREVGRPVTLALRAFEQGRWAEAADTLRRVRNNAAVFGGSHAQRDLLDLTLLAAARHSGDARLLNALEAERLAARPGSPWTLRGSGRPDYCDVCLRRCWGCWRLRRLLHHCCKALIRSSSHSIIRPTGRRRNGTSCAISSRPMGRNSRPTTGRNQKKLAAINRMPSGMRTQRACGRCIQCSARASGDGKTRSSRLNA